MEAEKGQPERKGPRASAVSNIVIMHWASSIHIFIWPFIEYV
jgi:hypothetical protein